MPNHIQNKLQFIGNHDEVQSVLNYIKEIDNDGKEIQIDFNKIIPMPKSLDIEINLIVEMWANICNGQIDFNNTPKTEKSISEMLNSGDYGDLLNTMRATNAMRCLTNRDNVNDLSDDDFNCFIQCLKNYREYKSLYWYDWRIKNWGTKWNAYEQNDKRNTNNTIYFQTAWNPPVNVIKELSKMFPSVTMSLIYADEDGGSNTGIIVFYEGKKIENYQPENQSIESFDIYFELHPESKHHYKLIDGKYKYIDD